MSLILLICLYISLSVKANMAEDNMFCSSIENFENSCKEIWRELQFEVNLTDVTLACEDKQIETHKVVLSSFSPVLQNILKHNQDQKPFIYFSELRFQELESLIKFMYQGEVNILKVNISKFFEVAEFLKIKGIFMQRNYPSNNSKVLAMDQIGDYFPEINLDQNTETYFISNKDLLDFPNVMKNNLENNIFGTKATDGNTGTSIEDSKNIEGVKIISEDSETVEQIITNMEDGEKIEQNSQQIEGVVYQCFQCDFKARAKINIFEHRKSKHESLGNIFVESSEINGKIATGSLPSKQYTKVYPCDMCDKEIKSYSNLFYHKAAIHKGTRYPCKQCNYKATSKGALQTHEKGIHEGVRYPCPECNLKASSTSSLRQHIRAMHEGIHYPCDKCDYKATTKYHIVRHKMGAHGSDRFCCDQCYYKTVEKHNLKRHIQSYHTK